MHASSPSDKKLLGAVMKLRREHPHLARAKLLSLLKDEHSWTLSENRLKKCLQVHNLNAMPESEPAAPGEKLPSRFIQVTKPTGKQWQLFGPNVFSIPPTPPHRSPARSERLKEIKPCALFASYTAQEIFTEMVENCLKPVIEQHKLEEYGFRLQQITHPMPTTIHVGFQNGWIFSDTRSSLWPEVNKFFLTPNKGKADEQRIGVALGYPVPHGDAEVCAVDYTEMNDMKTATGRDVCCVTAFEFTCDTNSKYYKDIAMHYDRCQKAAKDVGTEIQLDVDGHEGLARWMAQMRE